MNILFLDEKNKKNDIIIISVFCNENILLCRKVGSKTWEFPGGHIEENETEYEAAIRELYEETGIQCKYSFKEISDFEVRNDNNRIYGRLFYLKLDDSYISEPLKYEMEETRCFFSLPKDISYPYQSKSIEKINKSIIQK